MSTVDPTSTTHPEQERHSERYRVTVDQYRRFREDGFLVVPGLVPQEDVEKLQEHTWALMQGELPEQQDAPAVDEAGGIDQDQKGRATSRQFTRPPARLSPAEKAQYFLRIHMLHRKLGLHERYLLHPRVLDVLEVLIGPDVMALQSMLFLKPPGKPGQGWHQDSYYIPTQPDTLCGAWIAIDDADEYNGGMWFAKGSGNEPVHPPCPEVKYGFGDRLVSDVEWVQGVSNDDDEENDLARPAGRYPQVLGSVKKGDVVFFNGHVLHRSKQNITEDRYRRAFVGHFANARSFTAWGADEDTEGNKLKDPDTGMSNASHILARGDTHLPFAQPRFGTPCAATVPREQRAQHTEQVARVIAEANDGLMGCGITNLDQLDEEHEKAEGEGGY